MREVQLAEMPIWLRDLHALWVAKRGARAFPPRNAFILEDFMPWIGRLHLIEVLPGGDFRFAIYGASTNVPMRREYTGLKLSDIAEPIARLWEAGYRDAVARRRPLLLHHPLADYAERDGKTEIWRVVLPMTEGGEISHLLVGFQVIAEDGRYL